MAEEHRLRATISIYVADEARYREGIADLDALLARLATAEQERGVAVGAMEVLSGHLASAAESLRAAEARVEAAEQAVDSIIDLAQTFIMAGDRAKFLIRVAALACPPQQPQKAGE